MKLTIIRRTTKDNKVLYSIGTDFCIWSGMDGFGRYLWRGFELPDEDGIRIFDLTLRQEKLKLTWDKWR